MTYFLQTSAAAAAQPSGTAAFIVQMAPLLLIFVIFYILLIRPQQKRAREHQEAITAIKKGDEIIGNQTKIKVVKNKLAPPFKQIVTEILYGEGISREGELIDMGVEAKLVDKAGAWYSYGDERIGQGKDNSRQYLKDNPQVATRLEGELRDKFQPTEVKPDEVDEDAEV